MWSLRQVGIAASSQALVAWNNHADPDSAGGVSFRGVNNTKALSPKRQAATNVAKEAEPVRLLVVPFVELSVDNVPCRVAKIMVPTTTPSMPHRWSDGNASDVHMRVERPPTGAPQLHIEILTKEAFVVSGVIFSGIYTMVTMPEDDVDLERCHVGTTSVCYEDIPCLQDLGSVGALLVVCPLRQREIGHGSLLGVARSMMNSRHPLKWLVIPWLILLVPFVLGSGPAALLCGACVVLAFLAGCLLIFGIASISLQRYISNFCCRVHRAWHLRCMERRAPVIEHAFGAHGRCCICLGDPSSREAMIALLPCRHAIHADCYRRWVCAESYVPPNLICPLCRRNVHDVGQLTSGKRMPCAPLYA